ncbi:ASA1 [Candida margitis]|uniref:ASA1 n=1 Tax=Candida margitis TaxID=1775924 RepID=UPI002227F555|nr:ASA1 [Candida margitis]KAI5961074.1 ASA1 [Candida margitis]
MRVLALRSHKSPITCIVPLSDDYVLTSDQSGVVIKWSLPIKRPVLTWTAHTDSILTLLKWHRYIITHSRDSTIKIWLEDKLQYEFPVNALNFSNLVLFQDRYLVTPATTDSNNIDIYRLNDEPISITREVANFSSYNLVHKLKLDDIQGRNDFGIVMKMLIIGQVLYIGYESGDIIGLTITLPQPSITQSSTTTSIINKDVKLCLQYHNSSHAPNPIISLAALDNTLVSGSTGKKVIIHTDPVKICKLNESGIQAIVPYDDNLIVGFWNGVIESPTRSIQTIQRSLPHIDAEDMKTTVKLTCMCMLSKSESKAAVERYSKLIKQKKYGDLLLVGYEDGTIVGYTFS